MPMPTLSMFLDILIRMNWKDTGQHNSPHFHAYYNDYEAVFSLDGRRISITVPTLFTMKAIPYSLISDVVASSLYTSSKNENSVIGFPLY